MGLPSSYVWAHLSGKDTLAQVSNILQETRVVFNYKPTSITMAFN